PPPDWTARDDRHSERLFPQAPWRATGVPHRSRRPCSSVLPGPKPFPAVGENAAPPGGSPPPETDTAVPPARDASAPRLVRPPTSLPTPRRFSRSQGAAAPRGRPDSPIPAVRSRVETVPPSNPSGARWFEDGGAGFS